MESTGGGLRQSIAIAMPPRRTRAPAAAGIFQRVPARLADAVDAVFAEPAHDVVAIHQAGEHAGATAAQAVGWKRGVLERLPRDFEEQPLLRIEVLGLARADAKEIGVEAIDLFDARGFARVHFSRGVGIGIVIGIGIPAIGGHAADGVGAGAQHAGEGIEVVRAAGEATRRADDGDRSGVFGQPGAQRADLSVGFAEEDGDVGRGTQRRLFESGRSEASSSASSASRPAR